MIGEVRTLSLEFNLIIYCLKQNMKQTRPHNVMCTIGALNRFAFHFKSKLH